LPTRRNPPLEGALPLVQAQHCNGDLGRDEAARPNQELPRAQVDEFDHAISERVGQFEGAGSCVRVELLTVTLALPRQEAERGRDYSYDESDNVTDHGRQHAT
jgi:hypothetical protein